MDNKFYLLLFFSIPGTSSASLICRFKSSISCNFSMNFPFNEFLAITTSSTVVSKNSLKGINFQSVDSNISLSSILTLIPFIFKVMEWSALNAFITDIIIQNNRNTPTITKPFSHHFCILQISVMLKLAIAQIVSIAAMKLTAYKKLSFQSDLLYIAGIIEQNQQINAIGIEI